MKRYYWWFVLGCAIIIASFFAFQFTGILFVVGMLVTIYAIARITKEIRDE